MSSSDDERSSDAPEPRSGGRLDSWKEIAAYLRRSVRSARRWEKEQALPIRRHDHGKGDSVYAFKAELDEWWNNPEADLDDQNGAERSAILPRRSRTAVLLAVGVFFALLFAAAWLSRPDSASTREPRPVPFRARDWVLISSFENRTGEPLFDGMLEYALEREISESRYVNVVPRPRIADALSLMKKPVNARIDAALGREICLRDGGIRALLTGRIEKIASRYLLSLAIVDPSSGATVAGFAEEAAGREKVPEAIRLCSSRLRDALGEAPGLIRQSEEKLASVTTPSLEALQLYSKADAQIEEGNSNVAEELLKEAVAKDPQFASAYIHLAFAIVNQGRPKKDYLPAAEKAFELSGTVSDRERYFILGGYYGMVGEDEKAKISYETLLSLFPDHHWAVGNLIVICNRLGQPWEAIGYTVRSAELNPKNFGRNIDAAFELFFAGRFAESNVYSGRAESLITPETIRSDASTVSLVHLLPAYCLWSQGQADQALQFVARRSSLRESRQNQESINSIGLLYLLLGRFKDAEKWIQQLEDPMQRETDLAMIAFDRGDRATMARHLLSLRRASEHRMVRLPFLLLRAGALSEAEKEIMALARLAPKERLRLGTAITPAYFDIAKGDLALMSGREQAAVHLLRRGLKNFDRPKVGISLTSSGASLMGTVSLARALEEEGDLAEAAEVLERLTETKTRAILLYCCDNGSLWMRSQLELARVYRRMGRLEDAQKIENELRRALAQADSDYVLLRELKRLETSGG